MNINQGEIYGKKTTSKFVMYKVFKVSKAKGISEEVVTLQNIDNPLSLFETTGKKLAASGYIRISQTPYIDLVSATPKRRKAAKKPNRFPLTFEFLEERADSKKPSPILPDLFNQH